MSGPIRVSVDLTNPGQFFACCGLFEIAERMGNGARAWFEPGLFFLNAPAVTTLGGLVACAVASTIEDLNPNDKYGTPLNLALPRTQPLRLDWWSDRALKPWAGTMQGGRMARAMKAACPAALALGESLFEHGQVVLDPSEADKKVEPFYFDSRRGANALAIDVGFSLDGISLESLAYPAVEFFALVGLQRFRPQPVERRVFEYLPWAEPLPPLLASVAMNGAVPFQHLAVFRFENAFRTEQRKHKAFSPAIPSSRRTP